MKILVKKDDLCIGCGVCEEVCSTAYFKENNIEKSCIQVEKGEAKKINVCNQCGACIDICPVMVINRSTNGVVRISKKECVGCFMCVGFCPESAMRQHDDYIEPFKCIACGLCAKECPTGAIAVEDIEIETKEKL
ncbi:4Fe-4S binding protein [Alkaliphilus peptidifermentans]|uniref:Fe-S-cluster-containing dehydrogenase component n=1 Tax=Alkaliphilus peptidifermentans DSM 18978 TaxID=1120976 RepID=A0A1G5D838_9FIRM|nr:4Fe-4S binding protein [Alkaliphilus peptidifermentans]SCY10872.1 Fe-S-cluster-containing dehydrogenase component [Alkaliphilus peptidifermentans DSM 18978]